jgi:periplasmic protein CpxP/Spy
MKIKFVLFFALMLALTVSVYAQPGGPRRTVEERVKNVHEKLDSAFKLEAAKQTKVDTVFANYYRQQDKVREELMSGGERPDFQVMREKMQPVADARDNELKMLLTDDQFKKWKEEIEPAMMPRRNGGGGGGNRP